jgi:hypothetical protein
MQCRLKFKRKEKTFSFFRFVKGGGGGLNMQAKLSRETIFEQ